MPLYTYACPNGHVTDDLRKVEERHNAPTCHCGESTKLEVQPPNFDWARMGCDSAFPTFYDKWAKAHERAAKGK